LYSENDAAVLEDLKAADSQLAASSDKRLQLAGLYDELNMPAQALPNYDQWLKSHSEDVQRPQALNGRCWSRALLNQELAKALSDCNEALGKRPNVPAYLDSRALVRLRQGQWQAALADYDAVLKIEPVNAWSRYCRSIVETKLGQADKAKADRDAVLKEKPWVAERAKKFGIE
jgi:tetratricopeptide (TPR) repeat protein